MTFGKHPAFIQRVFASSQEALLSIWVLVMYITYVTMWMHRLVHGGAPVHSDRAVD